MSTTILASKPVVLFDNILYEDRAGLSAGTEAADWRLGTKWIGTSPTDMETGPSAAKRTVSAMAIAAHNLSTNGYDVRLYGSDDDITWVYIERITPTANVAGFVSFTPVSYYYYRVSVTGGTGIFSIGSICVGTSYTLPKAPTAMAPLKQAYRSEVPTTRYGTPLGTVVRATPSALTYSFAGMTIAQIHNATWESFIEHIGYPTGLPFFMTADWYDGTTTETLTWFCWVNPGWEYAPNYTPGVSHVETFSIPILKAQGA